MIRLAAAHALRALGGKVIVTATSAALVAAGGGAVLTPWGLDVFGINDAEPNGSTAISPAAPGATSPDNRDDMTLAQPRPTDAATPDDPDDLLARSALPLAPTDAPESDPAVPRPHSAPVDRMAISFGQGTQIPVNVTNVAAGDRIINLVDLYNSGSAHITSLGVTPTVKATNPLTSALSFTVKECSAPWSVAPSGATCSATTSPRLGPRPVERAVELEFEGSVSLPPKQELHLLLELQVSPDATNSAAGRESTVTFTFGAS